MNEDDQLLWRSMGNDFENAGGVEVDVFGDDG
jgi:hypothetical protein